TPATPMGMSSRSSGWSPARSGRPGASAPARSTSKANWPAGATPTRSRDRLSGHVGRPATRAAQHHATRPASALLEPLGTRSLGSFPSHPCRKLQHHLLVLHLLFDRVRAVAG